jgi:SPP1 family predicted phage head-tail adaptor
MNAGRFDDLISIYRYTTEINTDTGEPIKTWSKLADVWAEVKRKNGVEQVAAEQRENKQTATVKIRFYEGLSVLDRLVIDEVNYNIISINSIERRMYDELYCESSQ